MALGGRHLVKAATGEDVSEEDMGGAGRPHQGQRRGRPRGRGATTSAWHLRNYLSFFPEQQTEPPPVVECNDPVDRRVEELYDIVPTAPRRADDIVQGHPGRRRRRRLLPDEAGLRQERHHRLRPRRRPPVGSWPASQGPGRHPRRDSADKAARFVWLCDAYGSRSCSCTTRRASPWARREQGIDRDGAKMPFAIPRPPCRSNQHRAAQERWRRLPRDERHRR